MNRRQFLRDSALAVMAVSVAPAAVLAAKKSRITCGLGSNPYDLHAMDHPPTEAAIEQMKLAQDYYTIRWPIVSEKYVSGSLIIIDGEMFHIAEASHDA